MKHLLDSLRWRLIGAMFFVFVLGLLAALAVDPPDIGEPGAVGWLKYVTEEPYQDFLILVPYTVAALGIMWAVSGWSMKRLASASSIAATIGPNNPVARIPTDQMPTEVRPLIGAFNGALDRLAEAYDTEQRFVAQVAHQLRTPLAVASLRVQRAKAGSPADIAGLEGDLRTLQSFTERLLDLARKRHDRHVQAGLPEAEFNLARTAREVAARMLPLFDEGRRSLVVDLPAGLAVKGRSRDLDDLIGNLLENALKHGRGTVHLSAAEAAHDGRAWAVLRVRDQGPAIPPDARERVFSRFFQGDANAEGHGLGLAIVREVAESHGGSVAISSDAETCIVVRLPLAAGPVTPGSVAIATVVRTA